MKTVFIEQYPAEFSIKAMCRVLKVACSSGYVWRNRRQVMNEQQQILPALRYRCQHGFSSAKQRYGGIRYVTPAEWHEEGR